MCTKVTKVSGQIPALAIAIAIAEFIFVASASPHPLMHCLGNMCPGINSQTLGNMAQAPSILVDFRRFWGPHADLIWSLIHTHN